MRIVCERLCSFQLIVELLCLDLCGWICKKLCNAISSVWFNQVKYFDVLPRTGSNTLYEDTLTLLSYFLRRFIRL